MILSIKRFQSSTKMKFTIQELAVRGEIMKSTPNRTPNRSELVIEYARMIIQEEQPNEKLIEVPIDCQIERFELNVDCLDAVKCFLPVMREMNKYTSKRSI